MAASAAAAATAACVPIAGTVAEFHSIVCQLVPPTWSAAVSCCQHSASECASSAPVAQSDTGASSQTTADVKQIPTVILFAVLERPHIPIERKPLLLFAASYGEEG